MKNLILISIGLIISIPTFGGLVEDTTRRKRTELSISATKTVNKHDVSIIVQFD